MSLNETPIELEPMHLYQSNTDSTRREHPRAVLVNELNPEILAPKYVSVLNSRRKMDIAGARDDADNDRRRARRD